MDRVPLAVRTLIAYENTGFINTHTKIISLFSCLGTKRTKIVRVVEELTENGVVVSTRVKEQVVPADD